MMLLLLGLLWSVPSTAKDRCPGLDRVTLAPTPPRPGALTRLKVGLTNRTSHTVDGMRFSVLLDGRDLPGYRGLHYFGHAMAPGKSRQVRLHNLRLPKTGGRTLTVVLREVYRVAVKRGGKVTTVQGKVACGPHSKIVVKLTK